MAKPTRRLERLPTSVLSDFVSNFNSHPEVKQMGTMAHGRNMLGGYSTARCDINLYAPGERGGIYPLTPAQVKRLSKIATEVAFKVADAHTARNIPITFATHFHTTPITRAMNALSKRGKLLGKVLGKPLEPELFRVVFMHQRRP